MDRPGTVLWPKLPAIALACTRTSPRAGLVDWSRTVLWPELLATALSLLLALALTLVAVPAETRGIKRKDRTRAEYQQCCHHQRTLSHIVGLLFDLALEDAIRIPRHEACNCHHLGTVRRLAARKRRAGHAGPARYEERRVTCVGGCILLG